MCILTTFGLLINLFLIQYFELVTATRTSLCALFKRLFLALVKAELMNYRFTQSVS